MWWVVECASTMDTQLAIHKAGPLVIPKSFRDELHVAPGDALEESSGKEIRLLYSLSRTYGGELLFSSALGLKIFFQGSLLRRAVSAETLFP